MLEALLIQIKAVKFPTLAAAELFQGASWPLSGSNSGGGLSQRGLGLGAWGLLAVNRQR